MGGSKGSIVGIGGGGEPATILDVAILVDEKAQGTDGGSFTSGAKRTRDLNTIDSDPSSIISSLSSNQFTLAAGKYIIEASCNSFDVDRNKAFIENITDGTTVAVGNNIVVNNAGAGPAIVVGVADIASSKTFEIQHQGQTTRNVDGFGVANNITGVAERYTIVLVRKIS